MIEKPPPTWATRNRVGLSRGSEPGPPVPAGRKRTTGSIAAVQNSIPSQQPACAKKNAGDTNKGKFATSAQHRTKVILDFIFDNNIYGSNGLLLLLYYTYKLTRFIVHPAVEFVHEVSEVSGLKHPVTDSQLPMRDLVVTCTAFKACLLYTSPSPRDLSTSRMPSSA